MQERRKLGALHCFSVHRVAKLAAQRMAELEGQLVARGRAREESLHGMVTHTQRAWSTHLLLRSARAPLRPAFRGWAEARASAAWEAARRRRSLELLARDAKQELLRCLLLWHWVQERSHARRQLSARLSGAFERRSWRQKQVLCQLLAAWRRRLCHRGWVSVLGRARPLNQAWFWAWRLASRRAARRQAGGLLAFQRHSLRGAWLTWRWRIQLARSVRHLARGLPREASAASFLLAWRMDARSTARLRHWQSTSRYLAEGREECRRRGVLLACIAAWRLRLAQHLRQVELQRANASRVLSAWHAAAQSRRLARERTAEREILVAQLGRLSAHRRRWARRALSCWRSAAQRFRAATARRRSRLLRCAFHALRGVHALGLWARERETARKQYLSRLSSARFQHAAALFHAWHLRSLRRRVLRLPHGFQRQGLTTAVLTCWRSHTRLRHSAARRPFPRDFAALVLRLWRRTAGRLARRLEASAPRQAPFLLELMVRWAAEARRSSHLRRGLSWAAAAWRSRALWRAWESWSRQPLVRRQRDALTRARRWMVETVSARNSQCLLRALLGMQQYAQRKRQARSLQSFSRPRGYSWLLSSAWHAWLRCTQKGAISRRAGLRAVRLAALAAVCRAWRGAVAEARRSGLDARSEELAERLQSVELLHVKFRTWLDSSLREQLQHRERHACRQSLRSALLAWQGLAQAQRRSTCLQKLLDRQLGKSAWTAIFLWRLAVVQSRRVRTSLTLASLQRLRSTLLAWRDLLRARRCTACLQTLLDKEFCRSLGTMLFLWHSVARRKRSGAASAALASLQLDASAGAKCCVRPFWLGVWVAAEASGLRWSKFFDSRLPPVCVWVHGILGVGGMARLAGAVAPGPAVRPWFPGGDKRRSDLAHPKLQEPGVQIQAKLGKRFPAGTRRNTGVDLMDFELCITGLDGSELRVECREDMLGRELLRIVRDHLPLKPGCCVQLGVGGAKVLANKTLGAQNLRSDTLVTYAYARVSVKEALQGLQGEVDAEEALYGVTHLSLGPFSEHILQGVTLPSSLQSLVLGEDFNGRLQGVAFPRDLHSLTFGSRFNRGLEGVALGSLASLTLGKDFNQSLLGVLPDSLQDLTLGDGFNQSLDGVQLPSLQSLTFGQEFNQPLPELPNTLVSLTFGWAFDRSLEGVSLPSSLQRLTFGIGFNQFLQNVAFPSGLQELTLGYEFNQPLKRVSLPDSLQRLVFGNNFNQTLQGVRLPISLQELTFGYNFNQSLQGVTLPDFLQNLTFGYNFNQTLEGMMLPTSLQSLTFGKEFNQHLLGVTFPSSLSSLTFSSAFQDIMHGVQLPRSLQSLAFDRSFNQRLEGDLLLNASLQHLTFGWSFNQSLHRLTLPESLQTLTFDWSFNHGLHGVRFPSGLQSLIFGRQFNQPLQGVTLPDNLKSLTFGDSFNIRMHGVTLPSGLQSLTFGRQFNQSLQEVVLPTCEA
ncbi:unnamed protein product [Effrenium voratum]|uniref:Uncharacterized protein n=1 Tax=Effrenium voratum TaxID=2562239 RepID=A0AA36JJ47_9DINO|nr:unnamed protein product [Effrenium voratum]